MKIVSINNNSVSELKRDVSVSVAELKNVSIGSFCVKVGRTLGRKLCA